MWRLTAEPYVEGSPTSSLQQNVLRYWHADDLDSALIGTLGAPGLPNGA